MTREGEGYRLIETTGDVEINGVWDAKRTSILVDAGKSYHFVWRLDNIHVLGIDLYPSERRFDGQITTAKTGVDEHGEATLSMSIDPAACREVSAALWRRTLYRLVKCFR